MSNWKTYRLGDVGKIVTGKTPPTADADNFGVEYPFITPRDMSGQKKIFSTERYLSEKGKKILKNNILPEKSVCVSCIGSDLGKVVMTTTDSLTNQQLNSIICNENFDSDFIYYSTILISNTLKSIGKSSTAVPIVNKSQFSNFEIEVPELSLQQLISSILTSLDDKIELNLQMNQTLETMAQAIFKEWFVDFKFPGFDGELEGGLPKGWRKVKVIEQFDVTDYVANGSFASLAENVQYKNEPDFAILIRLTDYNRGYNGDFVYINEHSYNFLNKSKLFGDEIIIANVGANAGDVFRAPFLNKPMSLGPNAIMIKNNIASNFLYSYLISELGQHSLKSIIAGSAQPKFNKTDFRRLELIFPDEITLNLFNDIYESINEKLHSNKSQIQSLTQTRDTLLPKLMSGKIEIKY